MNWGIGAGYMGLYEGLKETRQKKDELDILKSLSKDIQDERKANEEADLKEQKYYESISKFADTLLEEDRNAINRKTREMAKSIREHMRYVGGSSSRFFQEGGHKLLGAYKDSIVNSDEASEYVENKKNLEKIIDAQQKGLGDRINPIDLDNLIRRQRDGKGRVTYRGLLNGIDVKTIAANYAIGDTVPIDAIIDANYANAIADFKAIFPDVEPTRENIEMYVRGKVGNVEGTNININTHKFSQDADISKQKTNVEQMNVSNTIQAYQAYEDSKYKEASLNASLQGKDNGYEYEPKDPKDPNDPSKDDENDASITNNALDVAFDISNGNFKVSDATDGLLDGYASILPGSTRYKVKSIDDEDDNFGTYGDYNSGVMPAGARTIMDSNWVNNLIKRNSNFTPFSFIKDDKGNNTDIINSESIVNSHSVFSPKGIALDNFKDTDARKKLVGDQKYRVGEVIIAPVVNVGGKDKMITNVVDSAGNIIKKRNNEHYKEMGYVNFTAESLKGNAEYWVIDKKTEPKINDMSMFLTIKGEDGRVFYMRVNNDDQYKFLNEKNRNILQDRKSSSERFQRRDNEVLKIKDLYAFSTKLNAQENSRLFTESANIFNINNNTLNPLILSFYTASYEATNKTNKPMTGADIGGAMAVQGFTKFIQNLAANQPSGKLSKALKEIQVSYREGKPMSPYMVFSKIKNSGAFTDKIDVAQDSNLRTLIDLWQKHFEYARGFR